LTQIGCCCVTDEWHAHPADDWQQDVSGFDGNGNQPPAQGSFDYHEQHPPYGPFNPAHEDDGQFQPWQHPPGSEIYPDEHGQGPDMERFGPPGSDTGLVDSTALPSLMDIQIPARNLKRGSEHMDGDFGPGEMPPPHQFGPRPQKMPPPNHGPGNDMWPAENPPPPPMGPGRGGPRLRGGPGRGVPRGRGMRGARGR